MLFFLQIEKKGRRNAEGQMQSRKNTFPTRIIAKASAAVAITTKLANKQSGEFDRGLGVKETATEKENIQATKPKIYEMKTYSGYYH